MLNNLYLCTVKIKEVLSALERFAPLPLQESWDNAGLQVGLTETEVSGALLCLDVNEQIVDEAIRKDCNLIVSHHPLLFRGLKQVGGTDYVQRCVIKAIKNDICVVSMHTNMDNALDGVNFKMAEKMGAKPLNAELAEDEKCPMVVAELDEPTTPADFVQMLKRVFGVACVMCNELLHRPIRKVAICGGAGDFMLPDAVKAGADAFVTGEMHYHVYFDHEQKIQICVIGHYQSEQFTCEIFRDIIQKECPGVRTEIAETNTNPIIYL